MMANTETNKYTIFDNIWMCRLNLPANNPYISFFKNKNLIHVISLIGENYRRGNYLELTKLIYGKERRSSFAVGVCIIKIVLMQQNIDVSHKQIRRLIRPNLKKKHILKLPHQTIDILNTIYQLVHNSDIKNKCREDKIMFCNKNKLNDGLYICRSYLLGEMYECLSHLQGRFILNGSARRIYTQLSEWNNYC